MNKRLYCPGKHPCATIGTQCGVSFFWGEVVTLWKSAWSVQHRGSHWVLGHLQGVAWWVTILSDFSSTCVFSPFCDAFSSRLLMFDVNSGLSSSICGGVSAVSWRVNIVWCWPVDSSWNLLLLACTEALCMSRVGVGGRIPVLVPRDLERPLGRCSLHHPDWWEWGAWKCRSAVALPDGRSTSFNSTSLDCLLTQETRVWELTGSPQT